MNKNVKIERWAKFSYITDERYSYYKDETIYSSIYHPRAKKLWAQDLFINGAIMSRLNDLSRKYSKKYTILAIDRDRHDFQPVHAEGLRLVASLTSQSDSKTYPIPQHDSYFKNKTAFPNIPVVPFESKKSMVVWRGMPSATRIKLVDKMKNSPHFDLEFTKDKKNRMSPGEQIHYKYILAIDGHGWPGSLNWTLESGSVPLVHSNNHLWYFPLLEPWVDYVPVTMDNFEEVFERLESNPLLAKKIAESSVEKIGRIHQLQEEYLDLIFKTESYHEAIQALKESLSRCK